MTMQESAVRALARGNQFSALGKPRKVRPIDKTPISCPEHLDPGVSPWCLRSLSLLLAPKMPAEVHSVTRTKHDQAHYLKPKPQTLSPKPYLQEAQCDRRNCDVGGRGEIHRNRLSTSHIRRAGQPTFRVQAFRAFLRQKVAEAGSHRRSQNRHPEN